MLTFRPSLLTDAFPISLDAREIDRIEWAGISGPGDVSLTGQIVSAIERASMVWTACWNRMPIAIWGATAAGPGVGIPWMLGVPEMEKHVRPLIVEGRKYVALMSREFPSLVNIVHADNTKAHAWLRTLGFTIEPDPFANYHRFTLLTTPCVNPQPLP